MERIVAVVFPSLFARFISTPPYWLEGRPISREAVITISRWRERVSSLISRSVDGSAHWSEI